MSGSAICFKAARGGYHAYNACLKRVLGKARSAMNLAELEAAMGLSLRSDSPD